MRPLEISVAISALAALFWISFSASLPGPFDYAISLLPVVLAGCQIALEGYRWPMIPLYGIAVLLLFGCSVPLVQVFRSRMTYVVAGWVIAFLLAGSSAITAGVVFPVFAFAPLSGPDQVGTESLHLVDTARADPYAGEPGRRRELMVEVWYPAQATHGLKYARYRDGRAEGWTESSLALVRTRAFVAPPVLAGGEPLPVLLFSGPINRFQNTYETEDLASHGYVVMAVDHPYDADLVIFPDGRRVRARRANTFLDFTSGSAYESSRRNVEADLRVRVADVERVLDQLPIWNADPANRFYRRLDLARIGMFGHSFGGAVTAEICRRDPRVKAGINMDGWMFGESGPQGVPKPFFFMTDDVPRPSTAELEGANETDRLVAERLELGFKQIDASMARHGGYYLEVPGLEHMNYSDLPLHSRIRARTGAGPVDARRTHRMINAISLAFFDRYLRGDASASVAAVAARYPEAAFRVASIASLSVQESEIARPALRGQ